MTRKRWLALYDDLEELGEVMDGESNTQALIAYLKLLLIELKPELGQKNEDIHRDDI